jgi:putative glycosyltransferase (TIGR04348 family)
MSLPSVVIVSPALAGANNGNWQTAQRWQQLLEQRCKVRIVQSWPDDEAHDDAAMLALHARRSADAIAAWAQAHGERGLAVVLTGTDLYQDIALDATAQRSLALASHLVVLQERGPMALPESVRSKARVIFQSTVSQTALDKPRDLLRAVMVGHLREVKSPQTLFEAAALLAGDADIRIDHIGDALEPPFAAQAQATQRACPNYRWLGPLPHELTREQIRAAHLLVVTSALEGGAHVIMEAACSGTPVLASRVEGNVGMLGADYEGYFTHGSAAELAALLRRCRDVPADPLLARLRAQCGLRAPLFAPETERAALLRLVDELLMESP